MAEVVPHTVQHVGALLCIWCRQSGHCHNDCPSDEGKVIDAWFRSQARREMDFASEGIRRPLCRRCQDLDVLQMLRIDPPWRTPRDLDGIIVNGGNSELKCLGQVGSVQFWDNCPLCRCLFAMTPTMGKPDAKVFVFPQWIANRFRNIGMDDELRTEYCAKCLMLAIDQYREDLGPTSHSYQGEALCLLQDDAGPGEYLGGREIKSEVDIGLVKCWLSSCSRLHGERCRPAETGDLSDILLLDVSSRRVVKCPSSSPPYLALSYVWGTLDQQHLHEGSITGKLPQTIEDAIWLVQQLGERYLWVDSLCIDLSDNTHKASQISKMSSIYQGALLTIVATSGSSVREGLPRLGSTKAMLPQLACVVDGKRLVGTMLRLSTLVQVTPWAYRAWTLQEAVLSPRCLYMDDSQMFFECNGFQCCESLDETHSTVHTTHSNALPTELKEIYPERGALGNMTRDSRQRFWSYSYYVTSYTGRALTYENDIFNAFSGIMQSFEAGAYSESFFMGLPLADFQWALLWVFRQPGRRRPGFPSWSWAGWTNIIDYHFGPPNPSRLHQFPVHLAICKMRTGGHQLASIFTSREGTSQDNLSPHSQLKPDAIARACYQEPEGRCFELDKFPQAAADSYLFIEAITLQFDPNFLCSEVGKTRYAVLKFSDIDLPSHQCRLWTFGGDSTQPACNGRKHEFILLARNLGKAKMSHYFLVVHMNGEIAERATVAFLELPIDYSEVLEAFQPKKKRIVMA